MAKKTHGKREKSSPKRSAVFLEDLERQEIELAERRVGKTPHDRLRWVIDFIYKDLSLLRPEEKIAIGYDLRTIHPPECTVIVGSGPMPEDLLLAYQTEIKDGITRMFFDPVGHWDLPIGTHPNESRSLFRTSENDSKITRFQLAYQYEERKGIIEGVVYLILHEASQKLRACEECGKLFIATKRQIFCLPPCAQKARDRRKQKG